MRFATVLLIVMTLQSCGPAGRTADDGLEAELDRITARYAPDRRTDRIDVVLSNDSLRGQTTSPMAYAAIKHLADSAEVAFDVELLPAADLGNDVFGVIKVSVANLRSKPGHSQELATQSLMGTPIRVLDERDGWYLVQTPDRYLAWLEPGAFVRRDQPAMERYLTDDLAMLTGGGSIFFEGPEDQTPAGDAVPGMILPQAGERHDNRQAVRRPDGSLAYVPVRFRESKDAWYAPEELNVEEVLLTAKSFERQPYLWGGTSPKAMDCSGFTKTAFYLNGFVIPRDASQQVHAGREVALTDSLRQLLRGDLLFFGNLRDDGSRRITHVGFYLGEGRMLHAGADNGEVAENNLLPGRPGYSAKRRESLLAARRYRVGDPGVYTIRHAFTALIRGEIEL